MRLPTRLLLGVLIGALGAVIWASLARASGWELGYCAWAIGLAVGAALHLGRAGHRDLRSGAIAVGITLVAIVGGKAGAAWLSEGRGGGDEVHARVADLLSLERPERTISYLADEVVAERLGRGEEVLWPEGVDPCFAQDEADYPPDVWREAVARWEAMEVTARTAYIDRIRRESGGATPVSHSPTVWRALRSSFGPLDALFFVLALASAFRFGSGREGP